MDATIDSPFTYAAIGLAVSLVGSLFGAASATIVPLPAVRLASLADDAHPRAAKLIRRYAKNPVRFAFRWLVVRMTCVAVTAISFGQAIQHLQKAWSVPVAIVGTLATYGVLVQIFSLFIRRKPSRNIPRILVLIAPLQWVAGLLTTPLEWLARLVPGIRKQDSILPPQAPEAELGLILEEGRREGTIEPEPLEMIKNVLELGDHTAVEVMVPRTKVIALDKKTPIREAVSVFIESGHSRYPVYQESIDQIVGLLYAKDLFETINAPEMLSKTIEPFVRRNVNFVPESKPVAVLLREMKVNRQHMAVVLDDFGGVSGVVTLEDILEEIVGDIWDEHDEEQPFIRRIDDSHVLVDGGISIDDLVRHLDIHLDHSADVVSLAGWIVQMAKRVPVKGERFEHGDYVFTVQESDDRHVAQILLERKDGIPFEVHG